MMRWAAQQKRRAGRSVIDYFRLRPSFLIIGAQRAGTTSLYNYLCEHPLVVPAAQKELHFFDRSYSRSLPDYFRQYPIVWRSALPIGPRRITGEATPYYLFHPLAAGRVQQALPGVKLIGLLRNPIDRAFSHYHHAVKLGAEPLSFEAAIEREPERLAGEFERLCCEPDYHSPAYVYHSYLARGVYVDQLERWMSLFPREQFQILKSEDFYADPNAMLRSVFAFLGLPPAEIRTGEQHNRQDYAPMHPDTRARLQDYFAPHNTRLYRFLNRDFGWEN